MDPGSPQRVLHVCVANICRSPVAEHLMRRGLATAGLAGAVEVSSAGVRGWDGSDMDGRSRYELERRGVSVGRFLARTASPQDVERATLVLTATRAIRAELARQVPSAVRRLFTLAEFAHLCARLEPERLAPGDASDALDRLLAAVSAQRGGLSLAAPSDLDLADPYGGTPEQFAAVVDAIERAVEWPVLMLRALIA